VVHPACWGRSQLLEWIQQKLSITLQPENGKKFSDAHVDWEAFLGLADVDWAKNLAELVKGIVAYITHVMHTAS
jgi:hypothetical protein